MIPELGKYAGTVLAAYGVTLTLLIGIVGLSILRGARVRNALAQIERAKEKKRNGAT